MSDFPVPKASFAKFTPNGPPEEQLQFYDGVPALVASFGANKLAAHVVTEFAKDATAGRMLIDSTFVVVCQSSQLPAVDHCPHCNSGLSYREFEANEVDEVTQDVECRQCGLAFTDVFQLHRRTIRRKSNRSE